MTIQDNSSVNAFIPGQVQLDAHEANMVAMRDRLLGPAYRLMYQKPLHFVRGEGVWLYDASGRPFLDTYCKGTGGIGGRDYPGLCGTMR